MHCFIYCALSRGKASMPWRPFAGKKPASGHSWCWLEGTAKKTSLWSEGFETFPNPPLTLILWGLETNVWASFGVKTWGRRQTSSNLVASIGRFWSLENPQGCTIFYEPICCPYMSGELHAPRFSQKLHRNFQTLGQLSFLVKSNPLTMWVRPLLPRY